MTYIDVFIAFAVIAQLITVFLLWDAVNRGKHWQAMWVRETKELLHWKRYATLRDPKTGRYVKKDRR